MTHKLAIKIQSKVLLTLLLIVIALIGITAGCSAMNAPYDAAVALGMACGVVAVMIPAYLIILLWRSNK